MPLRIHAIVFGLFLITAGCKSTDSSAPATSASPASSPAVMTSPATPAPAAPADAKVKAKVDVCALLTSDDLKNVQGEALNEAQRSDRRDGDFIVAQCYYALPTTSNSVVLNVTTANEAQSAHNPRDFWESTFGRDEGGDRDREKRKGKEKEKERERAAKSKEGGEEEEGAPPEKVNGLGDEAFWIASRVSGALYVLKKDQFFRISVGGAGDEKTKLKKSKTLAQQVLKRI